MITKLYKDNLQLFKNILYKEINNKNTYIHLKGIYNDEWFNFIVPKVSADDLNFYETQNLIKKELQNGYKVSYYINNQINDSYNKKLAELGYNLLATKHYVTKTLTNKFNLQNKNIKKISKTNFESYLAASSSCFPDWPHNKEYSTVFFNLINSNMYPKKEFSTFVGLKNNEVVSYGSAIVDENVSLGYLHNSGTLESYRRQGYHTDIVKQRCNWILDHGINKVYAIVEKDGASLKSFKKLGFEIDCTFNIYS